MSWLLILCQLFMYAVVAISPALFLITLKYSLNIIWPLVKADSSLYAEGIWAMAVVSYLAFVIGHRFLRFISFLFYWKSFIHVATVILAVATFIRECK